MKRSRRERGIVKEEEEKASTAAVGNKKNINVSNDDILIEILVRLSASSVIRIRRVCKSWYSLTTDPSFVRRHTRRHCNDVAAASKSMLVQYDPPEIPSHDLTMCIVDADVDNVRILHRNIQIPVEPEYSIDGQPVKSVFSIDDGQPDFSYTLKLQLACDGLLCFISARGLNPYYICNPVTKTWTSVAESLHDRLHTNLRGFYLHRSTGEYRLLQCFTEGVQVGYEVATLNGEDGSWRTIYKRCYPTTYALGSAGKLDRLLADNFLCLDWGSHFVVNENLHWLPYSHCEVKGPQYCKWYGKWNDVGILVFDTTSEEFGSIWFPFKIRPWKPPLLLEIGDNLCIARHARGCLSFKLWLLKDYHNQKWVKMRTRVSTLGISMRPFGMGEEGNLFMRWKRYGNTFSLYDLKRRAWCITKIQRVSKFCNSVGYTESLVTI